MLAALTKQKEEECPALLYPNAGFSSTCLVKNTRESTIFFFFSLFLTHIDKGLNRLLKWEAERREGVSFTCCVIFSA